MESIALLNTDVEFRDFTPQVRRRCTSPAALAWRRYAQDFRLAAVAPAGPFNHHGPGERHDGLRVGQGPGRRSVDPLASGSVCRSAAACPRVSVLRPYSP